LGDSDAAVAIFAFDDARVTASITMPGVRTAGRISADALLAAGDTTYNGTPLRPNVASTAAISASRDVQSARDNNALAPTNARSTASVCKATRSFTWQLRHHAAVKSTNTTRPESRADATLAADQSSHPAGAATMDTGAAFCDPIATPPATIVATSIVKPIRLPRALPAFCARPAIHPVSETTTANSNASATRSAPACRPNTHKSQFFAAHYGCGRQRGTLGCAPVDARSRPSAYSETQAASTTLRWSTTFRR